MGNTQLNGEMTPKVKPKPIGLSEKLPKLEVYAALVAAASFLCTGLLRSYTSPALASMREEIGLLNSTSLPTKELISWIASSPPLASFTGTIVAGPLLQFCGRQKTLLILTIPFIAGWILLGTANGVWMILAGRISTGFAAGLATPASQVYVSECVRAQVRGTLGFLPPMMLALGVLIGFAGGTLHLAWRELAFIMGAFPVILFCITFTIPESPGWLLLRNRETDALKSLKVLRKGTGMTAEDIRIEITNIGSVLANSNTTPENQGQGFFRNFSRKEIWLPALISIGLMLFQQFCGANCVIFYLTLILEDSVPLSGRKSSEKEQESYLDPNIGALIVAAVQFIAFFVSLPLIDRSGRKVLLIGSGILMMIAHGMMGTYFYLLREGLSVNLIQNLSHWFPIACLSLFIASYSIGFGPIPFLIMSEIFPSHARSYLCSISSFVNHLAVFVTIYIFPTLIHNIHHQWTFWMFGACAAISVLFVLAIVSETKGKTLAEIEVEFSRRNKILTTKL